MRQVDETMNLERSMLNSLFVQACENIRFMLERFDTRSDLSQFVRERGTGPEIRDPPPFIDYGQGQVDASGPTFKTASFMRSSSRLEITHTGQSLQDLTNAVRPGGQGPTSGPQAQAPPPVNPAPSHSRPESEIGNEQSLQRQQSQGEFANASASSAMDPPLPTPPRVCTPGPVDVGPPPSAAYTYDAEATNESAAPQVTANPSEPPPRPSSRGAIASFLGRKLSRGSLKESSREPAVNSPAAQSKRPGVINAGAFRDAGKRQSANVVPSYAQPSRPTTVSASNSPVNTEFAPLPPPPPPPHDPAPSTSSAPIDPLMAQLQRLRDPARASPTQTQGRPSNLPPGAVGLPGMQPQPQLSGLDRQRSQQSLSGTDRRGTTGNLYEHSDAHRQSTNEIRRASVQPTGYAEHRSRPSSPSPMAAMMQPKPSDQTSGSTEQHVVQGYGQSLPGERRSSRASSRASRAAEPQSATSTTHASVYSGIDDRSSSPGPSGDWRHLNQPAPRSDASGFAGIGARGRSPSPEPFRLRDGVRAPSPVSNAAGRAPSPGPPTAYGQHYGDQRQPPRSVSPRPASLYGGSQQQQQAPPPRTGSPQPPSVYGGQQSQAYQQQQQQQQQPARPASMGALAYHDAAGSGGRPPSPYAPHQPPVGIPHSHTYPNPALGRSSTVSATPSRTGTPLGIALDQSGAVVQDELADQYAAQRRASFYGRTQAGANQPTSVPVEEPNRSAGFRHGAQIYGSALQQQQAQHPPSSGPSPAPYTSGPTAHHQVQAPVQPMQSGPSPAPSTYGMQYHPGLQQQQQQQQLPQYHPNMPNGMPDNMPNGFTSPSQTVQSPQSGGGNAYATQPGYPQQYFPPPAFAGPAPPPQQQQQAPQGMQQHAPPQPPRSASPQPPATGQYSDGRPIQFYGVFRCFDAQPGSVRDADGGCAQCKPSTIT